MINNHDLYVANCRQFYENATSPTLLKLYCSFIRPHLEYAAIVWNPTLKGDIESLENVQKFALRVSKKSWNSVYQELLASAKLPSLQDRRVQKQVSATCLKLLMARLIFLMHLFMLCCTVTTFDCQRNYSLLCHSVKLVLTSTPFSQTPLTSWNKLPREASQCNLSLPLRGSSHLINLYISMGAHIY